MTPRHVLVGMMLLVTGCATAPPVAPEMASGGALVFSAQLRHTYKSGYQPTSLSFALPPKLLPRPTGFGEDPNKAYRSTVSPIDRQEARGSQFLVVVPLASGSYTLTDVSGSASSFPVMGSYTLPIAGTWTIAPGQIIYAGRIDAVSRERREGEPRAGGLLPLLDQAVSGYAHATWDITISDQSTEDFAQLRKLTPTWPSVTHTIELLHVAK